MSANYPTNCPRCGSPLGSLQACFQVLEGIVAKEKHDAQFGAVHQFTTAAHALQHVADHNNQKVCYHLLNLCLIFEQGASAAIDDQPSWLSSALENSSDLVELKQIELARWPITVAGIFPAIPADEHVKMIAKWAESVWLAWEAQHEWARKWIAENKPRMSF